MLNKRSRVVVFASCLFIVTTVSCKNKNDIKIRTESVTWQGEYLKIELNYDTGGQDITLNASDFVLIDQDNVKYQCEGFISDIQPAGLVFGSITVMTITWQESPDVSVIFRKVPSNVGILHLKYRDSNAIEVKL